ncbi:Putative galactose oxidase/kelch, beta-propeller, kelch-type beta propeller [Septoria linicola]|uniref:Galactose oxidase/kelch, beta-propeller, kelch-type beta propeller n=1 Tax=Septoria linicola TaxID=215465 RepID=A0A9Q9EPT9_9PEZI|nr:Putative galactose oxidase/kelch, beta-propeller, kelch-type beta propeller [Septoria linicola]
MEWHYCLLLLACLIGVATCQQDPLTDFCRRWSHQTTVVNNKLFIDGGYVSYGDQYAPGAQNLTNPYLLYADLSNNDNLNFPVQYKNLSKDPEVPVVAGGALWADDVNKLFYLFGGQNRDTNENSELYTLWIYDVLYGTWNKTPTAQTIAAIEPPAYGASAVDPNKGVGYYYGGWTNNTSESSYSTGAVGQTDLIIYNFVENDWRAVPFGNARRAEGSMFYIPASDGGLLVYLGGVEQNSTGYYVGVPMNTIYLYDIASGVSYTQQTSGPTPPMRRRFCGGVRWPEDRSSYNFYLYGGPPPYDVDGYGFNDVWTLSLPSFTWTNKFTSELRPHHSASCDIVQKGQMIVMRGFFPNSTDNLCGQHNLNLGSRNVDGAAWYQYLPNITDYQVPPYVTEVIGGSATGSATLQAPPTWGEDDLRVYLGRKAPLTARTATRAVPTSTSTGVSPSANTSKTNIGAIAGGVVGGVVVLVLLLGLALCCLRRKKKARASAVRPAVDVSEPSAHNSMLYGSMRKSHISAVSQQSPDLNRQQSPPVSPPLSSGTWGSPQAQLYFPPPGQQYYPPPPQPQVHESSSPVHEMPNIRSPTKTAGLHGPAPRRWRSPSAPIHEE